MKDPICIFLIIAALIVGSPMMAIVVYFTWLCNDHD